MIEHPFEKTLVQYIRLYRLQKTGRFYVVWLGTTLEALPLLAFVELFDEPVGRLLIEDEKLLLIVFDPQQEEIKQWIP